jgi:hypothetical protein
MPFFKKVIHASKDIMNLLINNIQVKIANVISCVWWKLVEISLFVMLQCSILATKRSMVFYANFGQ